MSHKRTFGVVEQCLAENPNLRDDDVALYVAVVEKIEPGIYISDQMKEILNKYRYNHIVRCRAELQNKEHRFEASDKVRCRRIRASNKWTAWARIKNFFN